MAHRETDRRASAARAALVLLLLIGLALPGAAMAAEPVGRVLAASSGVTAEREGESARSLSGGDPVYEGDVIRTGARGRMQMRLDDGGLVDLEPASRFEIDTYEGGEGDGNVVMNFLRGAMRTITGAIGLDRGESYRLNTTVATIGVRGTAYALRYCDEACRDAGGDPGIYGRVDEGEIVASGPSGEVVFGAGDYFFLPETGDPRRIVVPPEGVLDGSDDGGGGGAGGTEDAPIRPIGEATEESDGLSETRDGLFDPVFEAGDNTEIEEQPQAPVPPAERPGTTDEVLFAGGFVGGGEDGTLSESAFVESPGDGDVRLDSGNVVGAEFTNNGFVDASGGTLAETGSTDVPPINPTTTIEWGRWDGPLTVGGEEDGDGQGGFVYAYTDPANLTPSSQLAGFTNQGRDYGSFAGGTVDGPAAVAANGSLWDVAQFSVTADFQANTGTVTDFFLAEQTTTDQLDMTFGNTSGPIDDSTSSLTITGIEDSDGTNFADLFGRFVGDNASTLLLRFDITGDNQISGIVIIQEGT